MTLGDALLMSYRLEEDGFMWKERRAYRILYKNGERNRRERRMRWEDLKEELRPLANKYIEMWESVARVLRVAGTHVPDGNKWGCSWEDMNNLSCGVSWIHNYMVKSGRYIMRQGFINNALSKNIPMQFRNKVETEIEPTNKELKQIERNLSIREYYNTLNK